MLQSCIGLEFGGRAYPGDSGVIMEALGTERTVLDIHYFLEGVFAGGVSGFWTAMAYVAVPARPLQGFWGCASILPARSARTGDCY